MDEKIKTWLFDILESIKEIESYFENEPNFLMHTGRTLKQKERLRETWRLSEKP